MQLPRKFWSTRRQDTLAEFAETNRFLRKGPNDFPAGVRENHQILRSIGGW